MVWVRIILVSVHFAVVGALKRRETGISQAQPAANSAAGLGVALSVRSRSAAMPIFTYFAVVGSVLIALLFVADTTLEKGTRALVTSQYGLPKHPVVTSDQYGLEKPWRPDPKQILAAVPAPAPDMTSPLVLAAQPKAQSVPEVLAKVEPAALAARAEAPPRKKRVTGTQRPVYHRQNQTWSQHLPGSREFGLSGSY